MFALIDTSSYLIYVFFLEDEVGNVKIGDNVIVAFMGYPDLQLGAEVLSIGWGIARIGGSQGNNLLANVRLTFEWTRLVQKNLVRIKIKNVSEKVKLRVGLAASILGKISN